MTIVFEDIAFKEAYEAEHGIGQEVDIKKAIKFYKSSFENGYTNAGLFLAKLLEKKGDQDAAADIYDQVIQQGTINKENYEDSSSEVYISSSALFYAKYRALRLQERIILQKDASLADIERNSDEFENKTDEIEEELKDLYKRYQDLFDEINFSEELNEDGKAKFLKKISYHQGELKLKQVEYFDRVRNDLERNPFFRSSPEYKKFLEDFKIRDILYEEAVSKLEFSLEHGYKKAEAELINIEAREIERQPRNFKNIYQKCYEALEIDPKNVNAKLIRVDLLLAEHTQREKNKSEAQELISQILEKDPNQPYARRIGKKLTSEMVEEIAHLIVDDLDKKIIVPDEFLRPFKNKEKQARREKLFIKIKAHLEEVLSHDQFIAQRARFTDINKIYEELSLPISNKIHNFAVSYISGKEEKVANRYQQDIANIIDAEVTKFGERNLAKLEYTIKDPELRALHQNREAFKAKVADRLLKYYDRCVALTTEIPGVPVQIYIKVDNVWNQAVGGAAKVGFAGLGAFLGPYQGGVVAGLGVGVVEGVQEALKKDEKYALFKAVEKFAKIGEDEDESLNQEERREKAKQKFIWLAENIVSEYGMQLDRISPNAEGDNCGLSDLAELTAEKMLYRLHETHPSFQQMLGRIPRNLLSPGQLMNSIVGGAEKPSIKILQEGVFLGKSAKEDSIITLKDSSKKPWKVSEVFSKPALTQDGEHIFCAKESDPDVYGVKKVSAIPDRFQEKKLKSDVERRVKIEFDQHEELEEISRRSKNKETLLVHRVIEIEANQEKYAKKKRNVRIHRDLYMATTCLGAMSVYAGGILGMASSLGFHPVLLTVAATAVGVSSAVILPVVIATAVVVGIFAMYKGITGAIKKANHLEKLDRDTFKVNDKIIQSQEVDQQVIQNEKMQERVRQLAEKEKKHLKYIVLDETSPDQLKRLKPEKHYMKEVVRQAMKRQVPSTGIGRKD